MAQRKKIYNLYLIIFWVFFVAPFVLSIVLFSNISSGKMGFMPTFEDLENPTNNIASEVIANNGELLGKLYFENRTYVEFDELSPNIVNSFVAVEDIRFYQHSGIDSKALARVAWGLVSGDKKGGGSTITQQLAKNLFGRDTTTYNSEIKRAYSLAIIKLKEWVTAVRLERNYTKDEILVMYLNTVPFGSNSFGIKTAARTFFNTSPDSLAVEQAAVLAGVVKAPTYYSPVLNPENSLERRNLVMFQMNKYGFLEKERYDTLVEKPLDLEYNVASHNVGLATYFRAYIRNYLSAKKPDSTSWNYWDQYKKWHNDPMYGWCNKNKKPNGNPYNLFRDGLKIYTTLDPKMQVYAEQAVEKHLKEVLQPEFSREKKGTRFGPYDKKLTWEEWYFVKDRALRNTERFRAGKRNGIHEDTIKASFKVPREMRIFTWEGDKDTVMTPWDSLMHYKELLRAGFIAVEPQTGHVKAYVGGINFKHFQWDNISQSKNQAGSTFKPFLYILAMQEGYSPCDQVRNVTQTFIDKDTIWIPKSAGRKEDYGKMVTLKWGLATSENNISAWLLKKFNPKEIVKIAKKMGIKSEVLPVPSMIYGTSDISVYEMASAYSTFANKGVNIEPIFIERIEDKNGNVLFESKPRMTEAISERTAYLMLNLMAGVVNGGTAIDLRTEYKLEGAIAGKTGTTNNHSDGWFMGITPKLVTGCWVGGEDRPIRFDYIKQGQGGHMALPIFAHFLKSVYEDESLEIKPDLVFEAPIGLKLDLDCEKKRKKEIEEESPIEDDREVW